MDKKIFVLVKNEIHFKTTKEHNEKRMSKKETEYKIEENRRKYLTPGTISLLRPKNAIFISSANSIKHELAKTIGALMLQRYGDIKFDQDLNKMIEDIDEYIDLVLMKDFPNSNEPFITEAVIGKRRIDLVKLRDNQHFEFEVNHKISKENAYTFYI